ncbi:MAG: hypothetical protein GY937_10205 [bacterium]|nr:hypothetical protein [bacterium]
MGDSESDREQSPDPMELVRKIKEQILSGRTEPELQRMLRLVFGLAEGPHQMGEREYRDFQLWCSVAKLVLRQQTNPLAFAKVKHDCAALLDRFEPEGEVSADWLAGRVCLGAMGHADQ